VLALQSRVKSAVTRVLVQLEPLETEATHCPVLFTETSRSTRQWAGFWSNVPLPLPLAYRAAIARAFPMHDSWVTPELIGKLL
jgi:hypothetical protein